MKIDSLWRYPVKGLSAENLPLVDLATDYGFPLDRVYAVTDGSFEFDPSHPEPKKKSHFLMLAKYERLALLKTRLDPDKHELFVGGAGSLRTYALAVESGRQAFAKFLTDFLGVMLPGTAKVAHADGHQFTDVSVHSTTLMRSISLVNTATVHDLERHVGFALDPLRFRANIYFEGPEAWSELDWVGRYLRAGDVLLRVVRRTRRCAATSVNLKSGTRDINLPIAISDYRNHGDCGIYAEVLEAGCLQPGQALVLIDAT
jgi:uncharacterized protein YcbX